MRVVSVDPAPGSNNVSTVFDGEQFLKIPTHRMRGFLDDLGPETLLCWDAPLTGPIDSTSAGRSKGDFTQRVIEAFFMRPKTGLKDATPTGISVGGYAGLQHWTITRSVLGLPRVGPYCVDYHALPFHLLPDPTHRRSRRPQVVEMHPAVAAWLWCMESPLAPDGWEYKDNRKIRDRMWEIVRGRFDPPLLRIYPTNDDEFDAAVGFLLGSIFLRDRYKAIEEREVDIVGCRRTGAWLLPVVESLKSAWNSFWPEELASREVGKH